jgi:hypothetical protein
MKTVDWESAAVSGLTHAHSLALLKLDKSRKVCYQCCLARLWALPREVRMQRRRMRRLGIRRALLLLGAAAWVAAWLAPARAQQSAPAASSPAATPAKPKPKPAKPATNPETKPEAAKPASPAAAAAGGVQPKLLGQYGIWGAYTASPGGKKVCFALAKPTASETNPPNRPRNPVYMFISTRPADKVSNEISLVVGYPFKPGTEATAQVGGASFALYTQQDGAWIKNGTDEAKMVDAMRGGDNAVIKGVSAKGTQSIDTFSLKGVAQALDRTAQECK